jgi:membrane fusion protein, multidrug efflux system
MNKRLIAIGCAVVLGVVAVAGAVRWVGKSDRVVAQANGAEGSRAVAVEVGQAVRKKSPVVLDALGNVTTIASVALKARIDNEIIGIHFADGASVRQGDLLVTLDTRALSAQIKQAEGNIAKDQAQLEGAERDVRRYTELVSKNATPVVNLDNAKTQADTFRAAIKADQAALENLKVQLSYCFIRAPISGRISMAALKVGSFVRSADAIPIAVINQIAPVYVTFTVPQRSLPDIRHAIASETATVEAIIPGEPRRAAGQVTMIENAIDTSTGMAIVRATMPNADELLWPGTLVTAQLKLRVEDAVVVPAAAVQVSQTGPFVFVVKDGAAVVQPVTVARSFGSETVIEAGLDGGETVVTDGHLLITNGTPVTVRIPRAGA